MQERAGRGRGLPSGTLTAHCSPHARGTHRPHPSSRALGATAVPPHLGSSVRVGPRRRRESGRPCPCPLPGTPRSVLEASRPASPANRDCPAHRRLPQAALLPGVLGSTAQVHPLPLLSPKAPHVPTQDPGLQAQCPALSCPSPEPTDGRPDCSHVGATGCPAWAGLRETALVSWTWGGQGSPWHRPRVLLSWGRMRKLVMILPWP